MTVLYINDACINIGLVAGTRVEDARKSAVLLSLLGGKVYGTLRNLLSPEQPSEKSYVELKTVLKAQYEPKPIIKAEHFHFHTRNQNPTDSNDGATADAKPTQVKLMLVTCDVPLSKNRR